MQKQFRDKNHKKQKKYLKNHKKRSLRPYKISKFFNYQTVYTLLSNPSVYMSVIVRNLKCLSTLYCRNCKTKKHRAGNPFPALFAFSFLFPATFTASAAASYCHTGSNCPIPHYQHRRLQAASFSIRRI